MERQKNTAESNLGYWVRRFFTHYMVDVRNRAVNTIKSYRDTFSLLIPYLSSDLKKKADMLEVSDINPETTTGFLRHIETERKCSVSTRNQRRAAIMAFAEFVSKEEITYLEWCHNLRNIPEKRCPPPERDGIVTPVIVFLTKEEMNAIFDCCDRSTDIGARDYAILKYMYNSGARATEVTQLKVGNLSLEKGGKVSTVTFSGKNNKPRVCPLLKETVNLLDPYVKGKPKDDIVFLNRYGRPLTRHGIYELVERYARKAAEKVPSLRDKNVTPHTIRHSIACHLLEAGVDINTIRAWLGHSSVDVTNVYAEVSMQMKAEAVRTCETGVITNGRSKNIDARTLEFLKSL